MADSKITGLGANTTPLTTDLMLVVDDPAGTAVLQKMTIASLLTLAVSNVVVQTITAGSGSYTPTALMKKCLVILQGPGGSGASVTAADDVGGGGGGGGTCIRLCTAAEVGASVAYVVGTTGNASTFAVNSMTANTGGAGSATGNTTTVGVSAAGGAGGTATGGDLNITGSAGGRGIMYSTTVCKSGEGGSSMLGGGGLAVSSGGTGAGGNAGGAYGGGGSGAATSDDSNQTGGTGASGILYIIEFLD